MTHPSASSILNPAANFTFGTASHTPWPLCHGRCVPGSSVPTEVGYTPPSHTCRRRCGRVITLERFLFETSVSFLRWDFVCVRASVGLRGVVNSGCGGFLRFRRFFICHECYNTFNLHYICIVYIVSLWPMSSGGWTLNLQIYVFNMTNILVICYSRFILTRMNILLET